MLAAKPSSLSVNAAAFHRARHCSAVVFLALSSNRDGVVDARVQCAVSKGAVLDADKLAEDLRGLAVWIGAGQLRTVLDAQSTFLPSGRGSAAVQMEALYTRLTCSLVGTSLFHTSRLDHNNIG